MRESITIIETFNISLEARKHPNIEGDIDWIPSLSCVPLAALDLAWPKLGFWLDTAILVRGPSVDDLSQALLRQSEGDARSK